MPEEVKKGKLVIIVAPSGTGKSTLLKKVKVEFPMLNESVSYTTRAQRPGETHGVDYFFVSEDEFINMKDSGEFLEWALVHDDYKGSSLNFVEGQLSEGHSLLFDLDVQGADSMKKFFGNQAQVIFIAPPSLEELERRLRDRGTESEDKIQIRLSNAKAEMARVDDYDFIVKNDELERASLELRKVIKEILEGNSV